ncbi:MAG: hypothetical protein SWH78_17520 [Thermodesulfobacteriota bacterium]|nr:hypothetical protein [Thermodesulfobacteriota bacterium]
MLNIEDRIHRVKHAFADYLSREENEVLISFEVIHILERPFSAIVFITAKTTENVRKVVIKTVVDHPMNRHLIEQQNQAEVEYDVLKHLHPRFAPVENCSVPHPILVIPEIDTYLMEFVDGTLLSDKLRYDRYFASKNEFATLVQYFKDCGRWLKKFQEFTGIDTAGVEILNTVIGRCEHRLKHIESARHTPCPKKLRAKVMNLLHDQISCLSKTQILVSGRHGDFSSFNILCGPEGINVIDFLGFERDSVTIDLISMLVHLENESLCMSSNPWRVRALMDSFLEGFGDVPQIPAPVLIISEASIRVISLWGNISRTHKRIHHKIEAKRCIKKDINWLINAKKQDLLWPTVQS